MVSVCHGAELAGDWHGAVGRGQELVALAGQSRGVQEVWAGAPILGCRCCLTEGGPENSGVFLAHPMQGLGSSGSSLPIQAAKECGNMRPVQLVTWCSRLVLSQPVPFGCRGCQG